MIRDLIDELSVFATLSAKPYIFGIYQCGLLTTSDQKWFGCFPNGIAIVTVDGSAFKGSEESSGTEPATVEIMTSVAQSSINTALSLATVYLVSCTVGDDFFKEYIAEQHISQLINQMFFLLFDYVIHVSASGNGILYVVIS